MLALLVVWMAAPSPVQGQNWFDVLPEASSFRIDGTSTVNSFSCVTEEVQGAGGIEERLMRSVNMLNERAHPRAHLAVPVRSFDCGQRRMNKDMYEALQADEHPAITYELEQVTLISLRDEDAADGVKVAVRGTLTIAGETRSVRFIVEGREVTQGLYRIQGTTTLRMTDFGVKPPTALLGLVRAHDVIDVHFDLVVGCRRLLAQAAEEGITEWQAYAQVQEQPDCVE